MIVSDDDKLRALKQLVREPNGAYLSYLIRQIKPELARVSPRSKTYHSFYMKILRFFQKLQSTNYVTITKRYGMLFIKITSPQIFDLIKASEKFKLRETKLASKGFIPKRSHYLRIEAIKIALKCKLLDNETQEELAELFEEYIEECNSKFIVLKRKPEVSTDYPLFLKIDYKTRFTDKAYKRRMLKKYDKIWHNASSKYKNAVFLTLTTDPKRFKSIFHSWRHFGIALNRFMSYLTKYLKKRPRYIAVYEFTKSGLLHVHIVIFGLSFLIPKQQITKEWERCGQGTINYVYAIKNDGRKWSWVREKPKSKNANTDVKTYLCKYLKKCLFESEQLVLYFVSNKRFFSYSRHLFKRVSGDICRISAFYFLGVYSWGNLPDILYNYFILGYEPEPLASQPSNFLRDKWLSYSGIQHRASDYWV